VPPSPAPSWRSHAGGWDPTDILVWWMGSKCRK
jgi:hypothetical protein